MAKKYIAHQSIWLLIIMATYLTGGSCDSCNRKRNRTTTPTPKSTPKPIDKSDATSSASSGYASDSDGSTSSGSSSYSNFSSGSASSSRSSSPAPRTDFAGLPNIGNSCYMNAALQIITALYEDKVESHSGLKKLVNKINNSHQPLTSEEMNEFVGSLPEKAKEIVKEAQSGKQQDPHEFILHLEKELNLDPIDCRKRLLFKTDKKDLYQQFNSIECKEPQRQLFVSLDNKKTTQCSLSDMVAFSREELVEDRHITKNSNHCSLHKESKSSFLKENENSLRIQNKQGDKLEHYIEQQVISKSQIPSVLYVQLKRFTNENNKIETPVDGTFELTIKPDPNLSETIDFDLHGFILHAGNTNGGHYVAYVKRNGQWYKADDSSVTPVDKSKAIDQSKQAYLLFYKKK